MNEGELPGEADDLYALAPSDFTAARDALAAELKKHPDNKQAAAAVKKLKRPTVAAWALNQIARNNPPLAQELQDAATALQEAQSSGKGYREASEGRNEVIARLLDGARRVLSLHGPPTESVLRQVRETLLAAVSDADVMELFLKGRLTTAMSPGASLAFETSVAHGSGDASSSDEKDEQQTTERRAAEREALVAKLNAEIERLQVAERDARSRAKAAEREAERLSARIDELSRLLVAKTTGYDAFRDENGGSDENGGDENGEAAVPGA